jgi:hypothetical protein
LLQLRLRPQDGVAVRCAMLVAVPATVLAAPVTALPTAPAAWVTALVKSPSEKNALGCGAPSAGASPLAAGGLAGACVARTRRRGACGSTRYKGGMLPPAVLCPVFTRSKGAGALVWQFSSSANERAEAAAPSAKWADRHGCMSCETALASAAASLARLCGISGPGLPWGVARIWSGVSCASCACRPASGANTAHWSPAIAADCALRSGSIS